MANNIIREGVQMRKWTYGIRCYSGENLTWTMLSFHLTRQEAIIKAGYLHAFGRICEVWFVCNKPLYAPRVGNYSFRINSFK